jgi:type III restriction enzyme
MYANQPPTAIDLRRYQQRALDEVREYLIELYREQTANDDDYAALRAWNRLKKLRALSGTAMGNYGQMATGDGRDLPNFCLLVPTGGGKTLLATQIIGSALQILLPEREGGGLVLWLVPTQSIYDQTVTALRDPTHLYYRALKESTGSRVKVWEKDQVGGITPAGMRRDLNVLVLMLQSVARRTPTPDEEVKGRKSDFLRYFRDGRVLSAHFPPEDDEEAHARLRDGYTTTGGELHTGTSNLDCIADTSLVRTSLANLVRLCRPIVIVDEQQKAASTIARDTLAQLNPALLVQLSATPRQTNLLVRVTGKELLKEEMIKLPIAVHSDGIGDWQRCLDAAHRKRDELEQAADNWRAGGSGKYIRPIVVVQAERTGKNQRDDARFTHSEDVRHYLTINLGVPSEHIAIKTAEQDDLKNVDLLDEACPIRWIITRDALREGWDCPFAYALVSLLSSSSLDALTQLVGRVLRQPYQMKTGDSRLDRCYVFARHSETDKTLTAVRKSLDDAGLEGDGFIYEEKPGLDSSSRGFITSRLRPELAENYAPIPHKILLPRFCVRDNPEADEWQPLDWYGHLMPFVDDRSFDLSRVAEWRLGDELKRSRDRYTLLSIEQLMPELHDDEIAVESVDTDEASRAWLTINVDLPHFSVKERARVIERALARLVEHESNLVGKLAFIRYALRDRLTELIETETDRLAEAHFRMMIADKRIGFTYLYEPCRYELPEAVRRSAGRRLRFDDSEPRQAAMDFEPESDYNGLERDFAYTADKDDEVYWWYRNISGEFGIQGWRRRRFYPDFVVQMRYDGDVAPAFLMVETKGAQLMGNLDTNYKRAVAACFNDLGQEVPWQQLKGWERNEDNTTEHYFQFRVLEEHERLESAWKDEWQKMKEKCREHLRPITGSATFLRRK